ncbi:DUF4351 domain-containing protein [Trichormus azollae]|jgi:hypothetical protein|uniref:DUF4351 domain-containing protein n=1 Tax=Trichormus azollae TaxID=1164 RepID=UPI0001956E1B|nr:DUF4351 domain-containing protein [Trichormus azollae]
MPLVGPTEKLAMEHGELIGEEQLIIQQLNQRFGVITSTLIEYIHQLTVKQLGLLGKHF